MQTSRILAAVSAAASLALVACSEPETVIVNQYDPQAEALKNAAPVQLPPAIIASRTYRCRDNSLVFIEFLNNNTAMVRKERGATEGTQVTSTGEGQAYTGGGYSVSANAEQITYSAPGKGSQSCRA